MSYPHILYHGAIAGVTGPCHQLRMDTHVVLLDCCLFTVAEISPEGRAGVNNSPIDFSLNCIKALVFIRACIDHVGHIPYLLAAGFKVPILCSPSSAKLLPVVMKNSFKFGFSRDQQQAEQYIKLLEQCIIALSYLLFVGYQALWVRRCAIRMYAPLGGYVLIGKVHYGIRARISTSAGCSTRTDQPGWGACGVDGRVTVRHLYCATPPCRDLSERYGNRHHRDAQLTARF